MKKLLQNQSGFSMINVLMAAAMAGGVALVIAQLGKNAATVTKNATHSAEINEAYNRIQKYFLHSKSCVKSLETLYSSNTFTLPRNQIPIGQKRYLSSIKTFFGPEGAEIEKEFFEVGKAIGAGSRIVTNEIELTRIDAENLEVKIEFDKDPDPVKKRTITKTFSLNASFTGNIITKCFSQLDSAIASACKSIDSNAVMNGANCELSQEFKEAFVEEVFNNPAKRTPMYKDSTGKIIDVQTIETDRKENDRCNAYPSYPSCPTGWISTGTGRRRNSGIGDGCGSRRRKYSWRDCKFVPPFLGYVFKP